MDDSTSSGQAGPDLISLDVPTAPRHFVSTTSSRRLEEALTSGNLPSIWVEGPTGVGKTTALSRLLPNLGGWRGAQRIECRPGLRLEESLYRISDFLRHLAIQDLSRALDQRTSLASKVEVLLEVVRRHHVLIWWDDIDRVLSDRDDVGGNMWRALILRGVRLAADAAGGFIFTSAVPPPAGANLERHRFGPLEKDESSRLWQAFLQSQGSVVEEFDIGEIPAPARRRPLHLRLLAAVLAHRGPQALRQAIEGLTDGAALHRILDAALEGTSPSARDRLEAIAVFGRPISRKAFTFLRRRSGSPPLEGSPSAAPELVELRERALVDLSGDEEDGPSFCYLHSAIGRLVRDGLHAGNPQRWKELHHDAGRYFLQLAARGADVWHFYAARCFLFEAERYEEAYQVHKVFIEELLRWGYLDLAREILRQAVETSTDLPRAIALGNLAIVHKNEAEYDRALELYTQARMELETLGDRPNLARVLHQLGNTLYLKGNLDQALDCYRESREISEELGQETVACATQVQVANVLCAKGEEEQALQAYEASIEQIDESSNRGMIAAVRLQTGQLHLSAGRYVEAERDFEEAERHALLGKDARSRLRALRSRGIVLRELRDFDRAAEYLGQAEELAVQLGDRLEKANCRLLRGELEEMRGQFAPALEAYEETRRIIEEIAAEGMVSGRGLEALRKTVDSRTEKMAQRIGREAYERLIEATRKK